MGKKSTCLICGKTEDTSTYKKSEKFLSKHVFTCGKSATELIKNPIEHKKRIKETKKERL
jgi:hypothetical protein